MLVRERPRIVLELLALATGLVVPDGAEVAVEGADFTHAVPLERRADLVIVLQRGGIKELALVVEVQLGVDPEKPFAWPLYAASLHASARCATHLVVIAASRRVAAWAREPIPTFEGFAPIVLGPEEIPRIESVVDAARSPELAFLSALIHGGRRGGRRTLEAALHVADSLDAFRAAHYVDLVYSAHPAAARAAMEVVMTSHRMEFKSEFMRKLAAEGLAKGLAEGRAKGLAEGRAEGARRALVVVLEARRVELSHDVRARIDACTDVDALERWIARAATVTRGDEIFEAD